MAEKASPGRVPGGRVPGGRRFRPRRGRRQLRHDPEAIGHGEYTFFDDESDGSAAPLPRSRVVTVRLDLATRVATALHLGVQPGRAAGVQREIPGRRQHLPCLPPALAREPIVNRRAGIPAGQG